MRLYDALDAQVKDFVPVNPESISIYVCGATPYDTAHVGHACSMLRFDLLRRFLLFKGFKVKFVTNFTDIDDKTINKANELGIDFKDVSRKYIAIYRKCFDLLRVHSDTQYILATEYIDAILAMTRVLLQKGIAYEIENDGIYFEIAKFENYGKLAKRKLEEQLAGARIDINALKKAPEDFVLWKFKKDNEPAWMDPLEQIADGRPGWHLECSAMVYSLFNGDTIDIHGGGSDLLFPHHECEIAQFEACFDNKYVNHWMHNGMLNIKGEKMSKSLKNYFHVEEILEDYSPQVLRFFLTMTHYRADHEYDIEALEYAKKSLSNIQNTVDRLNSLLAVKNFGTDDVQAKELSTKCLDGFSAALSEDLDISAALASVYEFCSEINAIIDAFKMQESDCLELLGAFAKIDSVLAVLKLDAVALNPEVSEMLDRRQKARENRDFKQADALRRKIEKLGFTVLDTKDGYDVRYI